MGLLFATLLLLSPAVSATADALPSRDLSWVAIAAPVEQAINFDLIDARDEAREEALNIKVENPHTVFVVKRHIGASIGYDNTVLHGSVGLYMTIAEWGRWNFGVPSVAFGLGRYPTYDRAEQQSSRQNQATVFVSIASVHYRLGFVRSLGYNCYLNLEQVYDLRHNMAGSQFGFSFSSK